MKRTRYLFLLLFLGLSFLSFGQLSEDFEGTFTPTDWIMTAGSGSWTQDNGEADHTSGSGFYADYDCYNISGNSPAYLQTPKLVVSATDKTFSFWYNYYLVSGTWGNTAELYVDVSSNDGVTWTSGTTNYISGQHGTGWNQISIDLSSFEGQDFTGSNVLIRFKAISDYGSYNIAIDDVAGPAVFVPTCLAPNALGASNITTSGADLTWTETGTATLWDIEYGATSFTLGTGTTLSGLTANPYSLTGLSSFMDYEFYVRADCGGSGTSSWSGPFSFKTAYACPPNAVCGTYTSGDISSDRSFTSIPGTSSCPATLSLTIPSGDWIDSVDVYYEMTTASDGWMSEQRSWLYSPTTGQGEGSLISGSGNAGGTLSYSRDGLSFANTGVGTVDFEMHAGRTYGGSGCGTTYNYVADGTWRVVAYHSTAPACTPPNNLSASNITATSTDLGWTSTGSETQWDIEYGLAPFAQGSGTMVSGTTTNPYSLTGLSANMQYEFYVRADCGGSISSWAGPYSFTTPCALSNPITVPYVQDFESINGTLTGDGVVSCNTTANWNFNTGDQTAGRVRWGTDAVTAIGGSGAITLDRNPSGTDVVNNLILTLNMSSYTVNTDLELLFDYMDHGDELQANDSVWIRGSSSDTWVGVYALVPNIRTNGVSTSVGPLDIDDLLSAAGQTVSSTFQVRFGQEDNFPATSATASDGITFDDVTVRTTPSCLAPSLLNATNLTESGADLEWTENGTATLWDIEYGSAGFTQGAGITISGATTNPYSLSGLAAQTPYEFYVRANCGGSTSFWAGPYSFTTPCASVTSFPYTQDFDASTSTPTCWSQDPGNAEDWTFGSSGMTYGAASDHTGGGNFARIDDSSPHGAIPAILESVPFDLNTLSVPRLVFWYQNRNTSTLGGTSQLHIDVYDGSTWNSSVLSVISNINTWTKYTIDLSAYKSTNSIIRFRAIEDPSGFYSDPSLDDITIEETPSCIAPSGLAAANITTSALDLSWTENGAATNWLIEYVSPGNGVGTGTVVGASSNPYNLSGLSQNTSYDIYLRSFCSVGDSSAWVGPISITTLCAAVSTFPYSQNFDAISPNNGTISCSTTNLLGDCWSNESTNDDSDWIPRSNPTGSSSTGPSSDHTGGGNYLFVESSTCYNKVSILYSVEFDFTTNTAPRISFWNHMYGTDIGSLDLSYSIDNGATWSASVFNKSGDQGDAWQQDGALILALAGESSVIFRFQATTGANFLSDIAIDDIIVDQAPMNEVGVTAVTTSGDGCGTNQAVTIDISNFGAATQTSLPVAYELNGVTTSATWTGSLAAGASTQYTFTSLFDASAAGSYSIKAYTALATDADNTNDTSTTTVVTPASYATDYRVDFESGLAADWTSDGSTTTGHNAPSTVLSRNLWSSTRSFVTTSARIDNISAGDVFRFAYRYSNYSAGTVGTSLGAGDSLKVLISTDCGVNFSTLDKIHSGNHITSADMRLMEYDLSAYAGQKIVIRFAAEWGTGDYYLDLDEVYVGTPLSSNTLVSSNYNGAQISCKGSSDGQAVAQAAGGVSPYTFEWDASAGSQLNDTASALSAGKHYVTITDAQGYTIKDSITLTEPDTLALGIGTSKPTCAQNFDGAINLTVSGGTSPYTFAWSDDAAVSTEDRTAIDTGSYMVTITDANGCTYVETINLVIEDTISPIAIAQNINAYLDASGNVGISAADLDNGSTDACGIASYNLSKSSFTCADEGPNTVILTVTDVNSNQSTATATVTVIDTVSPLANCQNISVYLDGSGNASITAGDIDNSSTDNCSISSRSLSTTSFTCADEGVNLVSLTITDQAGNSSVCQANVTVIDSTSPVANCQNINIYLDGAGNASITASDLDGGSNDNCSVASFVASKTSFTCADLGVNTVILTVTDQAGNSSTCSATVTVSDTTAPAASCQNINAYLDGSGSVTISDADVDNGSTDNCSISTSALSQTVFTCADEGPNAVVLSITDPAGNTSTCVATVTVIDTVSPTASCQNINAYLDGSGAVSITPADINNGSSDNCTIASIDLDKANFTCADEGVNTVTLTIMDQAGNSSSCSATVTVIDTISPIASSRNLSVYLDGSGLASISTSDLDNGSSDNCTISSLTLSEYNFNCSDEGLEPVILTVTDQAGNASTSVSMVTVIDTISPTLSTQNINVYLDANGAASITTADVDNGTSDNCTLQSTTISKSSFGCSDLGPNSIVFTATDQAGNASNTNLTVTVIDTVSPTISTKAYTAYLDASGSATIEVINVSSGTSNACSIDTVFLDKYTFNCSDVGLNTVTVTAQTTGGSASNTATATVTVVDTISPAVSTQSLIVYLNSAGLGSITTTQVNNGSSDACGISSYALSQSNFDCSNLGANTVTLSVTDINGNTGTNTAIIDVRDTIKPVAKSRDVTVYLDNSGKATITPTMINNGSTDNCGITPSLSKSSYSCADEGLNQEYLLITDADGNVDSVDFLITVLDTISPSLITRDITVQLGATGLVSISANQLDSASSDNCSNLLFFNVNKSSFNCSDLGINTVMVTATDVQGNSTTKMALVTVEDNIAPTMQTQSATIYLDASGAAMLSTALVNNGSSDNCQIDSMWLSKSSFNCSNLGSNSVQLFARDASGNQNSSSVSVTVLDTISPTASAQAVNAYLNASGSVSVLASALNNGSSDNCGLSTYSLNTNSFTCSEVGANNAVFTATDASGNSSSTMVVINVLDTISPTARAKNFSVSLDASGNATISSSDINDGSSDACGISTLALSQSSFTCADIGANTISLLVTDNNGNTSTASATLTVTDNIAPNAMAQNLSLYLDASGAATISASQIDNGSSDNCAIATMSLSQTSFACGDIGNNVVILTVTDADGNASTATSVVNVIDTVSPMVSAQAITVYLNASGSALISASDLNNASTDNCAIASYSISKSSFDCSNVGANNVTLTALDASGNSASSSAVVTVMDTISPNVLSTNFTLSLDASGNASITPSDIDNGSSDACGGLSFSLNTSNFTCANLGANTVVLTVSDANGNSASRSATVTVIDQIAPSVVTQNINLYLDASGNAQISSAALDGGSSDNCAISSATLSQSNFDCSDLGSNTVTLTMQDASGNSASATATVTVLDTISPTMATAPINLYLNASGQASITAADINAGSSDNCAISSYSLSKVNFSCADIGSNTVTLTAVDASSNSSSMTAVVTVIDTVSPTAVAQNITVNLNASGSASITASMLSSGSNDACGIASQSVSPTTFSCADLGANTVILTITDNHGNSSTATSTVTVQDLIAPTVLTQNKTVYLNSTGSASVVVSDIDNGSNDNCAILSSSLNITTFDCNDIGQNLVSLSATDASGNTGAAGAIVTVLDTISPSINNLPANITAYSVAGQCGATVNWTAITGSDNCSVSSVSTSTSSGSFFPKGLSTVSVTVNDGSGNSSSSSFTINVLDTIAPVFTSAATNISVSPNAGSCDATVTWTAPTATDNCSAVSYTFSQASGSTFPVGNTTVVVTATDADGNSRNTSFVVSVSDIVAPSITNVPANITQTNDAGSCDAAVSFVLPTVTDNCTGATLSSSHAVGSVFPVGTTTVNFTATDGAGNTSSASFTVTVTDNEAPVVVSVPPSDTTGQCGAVYTYPMPTGSDNCTSLVTVRQTAGLPSGSVFPPGATVNQFELSDAAGNVTQTSFTIVIIPQGQPQLPSLLEICENDNAVNITLGQTIVWSGNGITNGGTTFNPSFAGVGRHLLSYVYTDAQSCDVSGSITVTVLPKPLTPVVNKVGSTTLSTGNYFTYQWYRDGVAIAGANAQNYTYNLSGNYQVEVSNTVGCFSYSSGYVVGQSGGGIGLFELDLSQIEVYPNPSNGLFNIALSKPGQEELTVSLYSLDGRKVYETMDRTDENGLLKLDVGHLPTANYMIYIRSNDQIEVRKILMK